METLHLQFSRNRHLRRSIMRRVWYIYGVSVVARPAFGLGFLFGASVIAFWRLVSVTSIILNLLNVRLGDVPQYTFISFEQADTFALMSFIFAFCIGIVVFFRMVRGLARGTSGAWLMG
jgi:hypothetical protein